VPSWELLLPFHKLDALYKLKVAFEIASKFYGLTYLLSGETEYESRNWEPFSKEDVSFVTGLTITTCKVPVHLLNKLLLLCHGIEMIKSIKRQYKVEDSMVFALGFGSGADFAISLALSMPDHITAICAMSTTSLTVSLK